MGCVSSREAKLDRRRNPPPLERSFSQPVVHGSRRRGDSLHVVSLKSSTLGFLNLNRGEESSGEEMMKATNDSNRPIPNDVTSTDDVEPATINAWELMEGLEDGDSFHRQSSRPAIVDRAYSFDSAMGPPDPHSSKLKSFQTSAAGSPTPLWMQSATGEQLDPEVVSNFRKAMNELSPQHPALLHRSPVTYRPDEIPRFPGIVKARVAAFQEKIDTRRASFKSMASSKALSKEKSPPAGRGKVVLYFTSLRGVRRTYEDCCNAWAILRVYGVRIDGRDVSMHGGFRDELNEILGYGYGGKGLPRIFVNGRHLGGVEEVVQLHESRELGEALMGCEMVLVANGVSCENCETCGGFRFLPCEACSGSCKVYVDAEEDDVGGFRRCANCNENGLVRCHVCY